MGKSMLRSFHTFLHLNKGAAETAPVTTQQMIDSSLYVNQTTASLVPDLDRYGGYFTLCPRRVVPQSICGIANLLVRQVPVTDITPVMPQQRALAASQFPSEEVER